MTTLRISFVRTMALAVAAAGLCLAQTPAQTPAQGQAKLRFEAASIKLSPSPLRNRYQIDDRRIDFGAMSLYGLVGIAFDMQPWQLTIPEWTRTANFDILATFPPGATRAELRPLLQSLLADRFGLAVHHETQEHHIFALVQSKTGAKLAEAALDNNDRTFLTSRATLYRMDTVEGDGFFSISVKDGRQIFDAQRITMAELAEMLTSRQYFDDPVVDMTALKGYWQLRFEVPKNNSRARARLAAEGVPLPPDDPDGVSLPAELRKLGLDIDRRKAPVDCLVVDHIEKQPTEN